MLMAGKPIVPGNLTGLPHSSHPDVGLPLPLAEGKEENKNPVQLPTPQAERHNDPGRRPANPQPQEGNIHTLVEGAASWKDSKESKSPYLPSWDKKKEAEILGTETARVAKYALVY